MLYARVRLGEIQGIGGGLFGRMFARKKKKPSIQAAAKTQSLMRAASISSASQSTGSASKN